MMSSNSYEINEVLDKKIRTIDSFEDGYKIKYIRGMPVRITATAFLIILSRWASGWWIKFSWNRKVPGVGLNEDILIHAAALARPVFIVDEKTLQVYVANPRRVLNECKNWIIGYTQGVPIFGIPKDLLTRYHGETIDQLRKKVLETKLPELES